MCCQFVKPRHDQSHCVVRLRKCRHSAGNVLLPPLEAGDLLVIRTLALMARSWDRITTLVYVHRKSWSKSRGDLRRRETWEDLIVLEEG